MARSKGVQTCTCTPHSPKHSLYSHIIFVCDLVFSKLPRSSFSAPTVYMYTVYTLLPIPLYGWRPDSTSAGPPSLDPFCWPPPYQDLKVPGT